MSTIIVIGNPKDSEKAMAVLTAMGIAFTTTEETAKAKTTKASPKETKQTSKKSEDSFDRDKYLSIAKELGCLGKHGVWKACRPTVYKVMDGTLTKAKAKAEVKDIIKKNGWTTK